MISQPGLFTWLIFVLIHIWAVNANQEFSDDQLQSNYSVKYAPYVSTRYDLSNAFEHIDLPSTIQR
jgi:hypothetical protein